MKKLAFIGLSSLFLFSSIYANSSAPAAPGTSFIPKSTKMIKKDATANLTAYIEYKFKNWDPLASSGQKLTQQDQDFIKTFNSDVATLAQQDQGQGQELARTLKEISFGAMNQVAMDIGQNPEDYQVSLSMTRGYDDMPMRTKATKDAFDAVIGVQNAIYPSLSTELQKPTWQQWTQISLSVLLLFSAALDSPHYDNLGGLKANIQSQLQADSPEMSAATAQLTAEALGSIAYNVLSNIVIPAEIILLEAIGGYQPGSSLAIPQASENLTAK